MPMPTPAPTPVPVPITSEPTALPAASTTRLQALLISSAAGLGDDALSEARALDPERAAEAVTGLVDAHLSRPGPETGAPAVRAVHLAGELRLSGAVPVLVRCLALDATAAHALRSAALAALARFGAGAVEPLVAAHDRGETPEESAGIAEALAGTPAPDDRVRALLVRRLERAPAESARQLAARGEWRAVPALVEAFDRLAAAPVADCDACAAEDLLVIANAVAALGGRLGAEQLARIGALMFEGNAEWVHLGSGRDAWRATPLPATAVSLALDGIPLPPGAVPLPARAGPRPGRNDPCPCGSGKKYKRCCLD
jgi:hypothetical protein